MVIAGFRQDQRGLFFVAVVYKSVSMRGNKNSRDTDNTAKKWDDWGTDEGWGRIRHVSSSRAFQTLVSI